MDTHTIPPMPDTNCPRWCLEDHRTSWEDWVHVALNPRPIPAAAGGYLSGPGTPFAEWIAQWEPYHRIRVAHVDLIDDEVDVDLVRCDGSAHLYLEGGGGMTAAQARSLSLALLDAADELDKAAG